MRYRLIPWIIDNEGPHFYRIERRWQPKNLIPDPYRKNLLKDAQSRFVRLEAAEDEFRTLVEPHKFIKIIRKMRLTMREAHFSWRTDDLRFLRAISSFMEDYGTLLRLLKWEEARGRFEQPEQPE